jgi:hypothetical protein
VETIRGYTSNRLRTSSESMPRGEGSAPQASFCRAAVSSLWGIPEQRNNRRAPYALDEIVPDRGTRPSSYSTITRGKKGVGYQRGQHRYWWRMHPDTWLGGKGGVLREESPRLAARPPIRELVQDKRRPRLRCRGPLVRGSLGMRSGAVGSSTSKTTAPVRRPPGSAACFPAGSAARWSGAATDRRACAIPRGRGRAR